MYVSELVLENFRLFTHFARALPRGPLLIVGPNAQGKTSLLEAIAYLATFTSFLARNEREVIHLLALRQPLSVARLQAVCQREATAHQPAEAVRLEVRIIHQVRANQTAQTRREVYVNGVRRKMLDALGLCAVVLFVPQMLHLVDGPPERRRRFLNQSLAQALPGYAATLLDFQRALSQRNALLKAIQEGRSRIGDLEVWDQTLAPLAARLMVWRGQAIREWNRLLTLHHWDLLQRTEPLRLVYRPALDVPETPSQTHLFGGLDIEEVPSLVRHEAELTQHLLRQLRQRRAYDVRRGNTGLGPQRDDFRFLAGGVDLASYGSRGQIRTALLLLKLAEAAWYQQHSKRKPILLLDDLLAELDASRRQDLMQHFLQAGDQVLLTTTDEQTYPAVFRPRTEIWYLRQGQVVEAHPAPASQSALDPSKPTPPPSGAR